MKVSFEKAIDILRNHEVVAVPTETVYGLAALASSQNAIEKIYTLKGRPSQNPLIVHLSDAANIHPFLSQKVEHLEALIGNFWPGPMTLVVPVDKSLVLDVARSGLPSAAFRVPMLEITRRLISETGPLVAPSANVSGKPSSTKREHIELDFGKNFPVLDPYPHITSTLLGLESTILIYTEGKWVCGRLGAIPISRFSSFLGYIPELSVSKSDKPLCPGQLFRHYAPDAEIFLGNTGWDEEHKEEFDWVVGFSERMYPGAKNLIRWGSESDPDQCARELYSTLRKLDELKIKKVYWDGLFNHGDGWQALIERLKRASTS